MATLQGAAAILRHCYRTHTRDRDKLERWEAAYRRLGGDPEALKTEVSPPRPKPPRLKPTPTEPPEPPRNPLDLPGALPVREINVRLRDEPDLRHYPPGWPDHMDYLPTHLLGR